MTAEDLFLKEGAYYFGNRLLHRNKDVGVKSPNAPLVLTSEGAEVYTQLQTVTDVEVKPAKPRKEKAAPEGVSVDSLLGE